ncbi:MAG: hypothetical protein IT445_04425 [Phycisphaeraceae bacterium]|nr:hypothetical protein [Phycisphaeraceae bacterium]
MQFGPFNEPRPLRDTVHRNGWKGVVRELEPVFKWFRDAGQTPRIMIHTPFGYGDGPAMDYDAYLRARQNKAHEWIYSDFVEAWQPLTDPQAKDRIDLVCYVGAIALDPDMKKYLEPDESGQVDLATWRARAMESLQPFLEAGASIGFDASSGIDPDSIEGQFILSIDRMFQQEGLGRYILIEALPHKPYARWCDFRVIMASTYWEDRSAKWLKFGKLNFGPDQIQQEVWMLINMPPSGETWDTLARWNAPYTRQWLEQGYTCCTRVPRLIDAGVSYDDLFTSSPNAAVP